MKCLRVISLAVAGVLLMANGAALAKKPVRISECGTVIKAPGKYVVTQDLFCAPSVQGIEVLASDVTVDLKGHTIACDAENTEDILVGAVLVGDYFDPTVPAENVLVKNGTVTGCDDAVIFFYTKSGKVTRISAVDNPGSGITLLETSNVKVKNNEATGNGTGFSTYGGVGNKFMSNTMRDNLVYPDSNGLWAEGETGSTFACNRSTSNGLGLTIGFFSSDNVVRGNFIEGNHIAGLSAIGLGIPPDEVWIPIPSGNRFHHNISVGNGLDLGEGAVGPAGAFVPESAVCANTFKKNYFMSSMGPVDCVGVPYELDEDDVCALDDDDDDSDSDSDSDSD